MHIKIGFDLIFDVVFPSPMLLMLYVHPSRQKDLLGPEKLSFSPGVNVSHFTDTFGNKVGRILAPAGEFRISNVAEIRDPGEPDVAGYGAEQLLIDQLPADVMQYLLASRYCEVDKMMDIAWGLFSNTQPGWPRVQAIMDWVHHRIKFGYAHARSTKTAYDAYVEQQGVCRDYMHLSITLLRAMNIPARYATGYLGDIGVPKDPNPMDFSAWFEVYLGGRWWTCDARHNKPRVGRILMAIGRDATDVALTTTYGNTKLKKFHVVTDEL